MKTLLQGLERYGIGLRTNGEEEFYWICEENDIEIIHNTGKFAFHFQMLGQKFIVLPRRRKGLKWLFTAWHELAHVLADHARHDTFAAFHGLQTQFHDKNEAEADAIALVALIPKDKVIEAADEWGQTRYGNKLWQERCRLMFLYGI